MSLLQKSCNLLFIIQVPTPPPPSNKKDFRFLEKISDSLLLLAVAGWPHQWIFPEPIWASSKSSLISLVVVARGTREKSLASHTHTRMSPSSSSKPTVVQFIHDLFCRRRDATCSRTVGGPHERLRGGKRDCKHRDREREKDKGGETFQFAW